MAMTPTPCTGDYRFTSDDPAVRAEAAPLCGGCPVRAECGDMAKHLKAHWGIWAGEDISTEKVPSGQPGVMPDAGGGTRKRSHCRRGHLMAGLNEGWSGGNRYCVTCSRAYDTNPIGLADINTKIARVLVEDPGLRRDALGGATNQEGTAA